MDGGIEGAEFNHLGASGGDEAAVRGSARGGELGLVAGDLLDSPANRADQFTPGGQKRHAGEVPVEGEI